MRIVDLLWLLCGVALNAAAQLALKFATRATGPIEGSVGGIVTAARTLGFNASFWFAVTAYGLSLVVWIVGLSRVPVSQAYPVLSVGYVIAAFLAWAMLGETIGLYRWVGIVVIIFGVWLISRSA